MNVTRVALPMREPPNNPFNPAQRAASLRAVLVSDVMQKLISAADTEQRPLYQAMLSKADMVSSSEVPSWWPTTLLTMTFTTFDNQWRFRQAYDPNGGTASPWPIVSQAAPDCWYVDIETSGAPNMTQYSAVQMQALLSDQAMGNCTNPDLLYTQLSSLITKGTGRTPVAFSVPVTGAVAIGAFAWQDVDPPLPWPETPGVGTETERCFALVFAEVSQQDFPDIVQRRLPFVTHQLVMEVLHAWLDQHPHLNVTRLWWELHGILAPGFTQDAFDQQFQQAINGITTSLPAGLRAQDVASWVSSLILSTTCEVGNTLPLTGTAVVAAGFAWVDITAGLTPGRHWIFKMVSLPPPTPLPPPTTGASASSSSSPPAQGS